MKIGDKFQRFCNICKQMFNCLCCKKYGKDHNLATKLVKKITNHIGLTQYYWASTSVPDPDQALSSIGFQDANKNKFFAFITF
jgi:hypothetical protein